MKLLLVDDHPIVRDGLTMILEEQPDFEVLGSAQSLAEARLMLQRGEPQVVLLDLELPDGSGLELLRSLPQGCRALILTAFLRDQDVVDALEAGVGGFMLKGAPSSEIIAAIRQVGQGETYLAPQVVSRMAFNFNSRNRLSPRESEVLELVVEGLSNKEIGERLHISERTAKFHLASIMNKLGADNRAQAAALAVERGLVRPQS